MFRKAMLGDTATLNLDFTTGVLDSRLTFTRASTATYINSSGYVTTMGAAPTNDPTKARFDYDPVTLAPRGLLIEAQTANVVTNSNALPNAGGLTRTYPTGVISPDGTANAQRFTKSDATTPRFIYPVTLLTVAASTTYTASIWIKYDGFAFTTKIQGNGTADFDGSWIAQFVMTAGGITVGTRTGICSASNVETYPNGWYRCTATLTTGAAPTGVNPGFLIDVIGTTGVSVLVYGAQLEAGSGASSYIPTAASGVTRNPDNCELLDLTTMAFNASAGTIYTDVGVRLNTGSTRNYTFLPASGASNQIFEGSGIAFNVYSSASFVAQIGTSNNTSQKIAAAYALNDYAVSVAGGAVSTDTSGAVPTSLTKLTIGGSVVNSASYMNGCIRVFKYYPTRLTNAQLQALTAP
jgi:hypothetical protein